MARQRWRQPSLARPVLALTLAIVLLLHALFGLLLWHQMRTQPAQLAETPADSDQFLTVRLINQPSQSQPATPPLPPALSTPVPPHQAAPAPARPLTHEKPSHNAMVVQDHYPAPAPVTTVATPATSPLFTAGSVRLPSTTQTNYAPASTQSSPAKPADDRQIMQHDTNHLHYKPTRFDKYFPPPNETAGGAVGRHIDNAIKSIVKSVCDPKSNKFNPLCGSPAPPPSPKDGDTRLSMPPAPLAKDSDSSKPPSLASCIAEYNATKPLSYGCPVNTPELAFKAEMRKCIAMYHDYKHVPPGCPADTPQRAAAESVAPAASGSAGVR